MFHTGKLGQFEGFLAALWYAAFTCVGPASSPYIIAMNNLGVDVLPHIVNAFFRRVIPTYIPRPEVYKVWHLAEKLQGSYGSAQNRYPNLLLCGGNGICFSIIPAAI